MVAFKFGSIYPLDGFEVLENFGDVLFVRVLFRGIQALGHGIALLSDKSFVYSVLGHVLRDLRGVALRWIVRFADRSNIWRIRLQVS